MAHSNLKKDGKTSKKPAAKMPGEWLYLNKEELPLRKIYELFNEAQNAEYCDAYLLHNGIRTVFAATIRPEDYEKAKEIMLFITQKLGGYFCADTADFKPVVAAK